jgi:ABC-type sugar transport system substrate-binding protein
VKRITGVRGALVVVGAATALALAACGTSSGGGGSAGGSSGGAKVSVDVGLSKPVMLSSGKLKLGIFMNAMSNQFEQTLAAEAIATAKSFGWTATVFDPNFDEQKQEDAMRTAIQNHRYDAWVVLPIDGNADCKLLTQTAPAANILVTIGAGPTCGRNLKATPELWAPGTYSYNAVAPSPQFVSQWYKLTEQLNPGPQTVLVVGGPEVNPAYIAVKQIGQAFEKDHPDFKIQAFLNTDYTAPTSFSVTQSYLQAHKDITLIMDNYSPDLSQGVVKALQSLNLAAKIRMTDIGGAKFTINKIKEGVIQATLPFYPKTQGQTLVQAIKDAQDGVTPKRIYDEIPGTVDQVQPITKDNLSSFTPQY